KIKEGKQICIEYTIAALMSSKDSRRMDAITVILAKNTKSTDYDLLLFISRKYEFAERILGIMKSLRNLVAQTKTMVEEPKKLPDGIEIEEIKADEKRMKER